MESSRFLECLEADYRRIQEVAPGHLDAVVPTCPDWSVADLVRHVAQVYLHKAEIMRHGKQPEVWPPEGFGQAGPLELLDRCYAGLRAEFDAREPGDAASTWYEPDQTVGFWIRRMAQETVIHRIDAELGAGALVTPVPDDLAVDGVDELLKIFVGWAFVQWPEDFTEALQGSPARVYLIRAEPGADHAGTSWLVKTAPGRLTVDAGPGEKVAGAAEADVTVSGTPATVLRWAWNRETAAGVSARTSAVTIEGEPGALEVVRQCGVEATQYPPGGLQLAADDSRCRAQDPLRVHRPEEPLERDLNVLPPAQGRAQFHSQPGVPVMRANRFEADSEQVIDRQHAGGSRPLLIAEGLDRPDAAPGKVLGHSLNEHTTQAAAGELAEHPGGHQQYRVGADRAGGKGNRPGNILRRGKKHIGGRHAIHVK